MQLCGSVCRVLILITSVLITGSDSAVPSVKVELHESATLPCARNCSGVVRWTEFSKPTEVLAECDQTSCRSVKEGYQMIRDQYLKGNFSLTITDADFSKRARYTCDCDGADLCHVHLQIEGVNTTVQMKPGEGLVLDLEIPGPVEVLYQSTDPDRSSSGEICSADGGSLQCNPDYTRRSSLIPALELRGVSPSDSGVYTVMDKINQDALHVYTVTVQDGGSEGQDQIRNPTRVRRSAPSGQEAALPEWVVPVLAVAAVAVVVLLVVCVVSVRMIYQLRGEIQKLQRGPEGNGDTNHVQVPMEDLGNNGAAEQQRLAPPHTDLETA